ncbi:MAG: hypothetical protein ABF313_17440, partial [Marivita sp.]
MPNSFNTVFGTNFLTLGTTAFRPTKLFASGEEGAWYDTSDISVLFQDTAGTTPVTASGQTIARVNDKSGNGLNATQATTAARPSYIVDADGAFIQHDPVDDALTVTLPDMGTAATVAYVTRSEVRLLEDQTLNGSYTLPTQEIANFVAIDRALTFAEKVSLIRFLAAKVEGVNYGAEIDRLTLIAINAVDVFVYDTSKDSDGGAWRTGALAQASSWYNETLNTATRGSRREFPAVAVIVAEASKVTIYDGDDPALPMWMVFNRSVNFLFRREVSGGLVGYNSVISWGMNTGAPDSACGLILCNFTLDRYERVSNNNTGIANGGVFPFPLAGRNIGGNTLNLPSERQVLVSNLVNDVAMTVLPDAQTDPATGLPVPTIAVATDGNGTYSTSIITDSGDVYDIASDSTGTAVSVAFDGVSLSVVRSDGTVYVWDDAGDITADGVSPD